MLAEAAKTQTAQLPAMPIFGDNSDSRGSFIRVPIQKDALLFTKSVECHGAHKHDDDAELRCDAADGCVSHANFGALGKLIRIRSRVTPLFYFRHRQCLVQA